MRDHKYSESAYLSMLVRNWYDACDVSGIPAIERTCIEKLLEMRKFLLDGVHFGSFPPPGRYIKSIVIVYCYLRGFLYRYRH